MRGYFFLYKAKNVGFRTDDLVFNAVEGKKNK